MLKLCGAVVAALLVIVGLFVLGHSLTSSASPVFENVTAADLAGAGVTILDPKPTGHPTVARDKATGSVLQSGVTVESSQLVRVNVAPTDAIPPKPSGDLLAWAIRLDTSEAGNLEYFGPGLHFSSLSNPTIVFVDATTGNYLREVFSETVTPTPFVGTQPPTYP